MTDGASRRAAWWPDARTTSRLVSLPFAVGAGAVLGVARWLDPSPLGHSTHTQLGLGQCSFLSVTGFPCPMCGMTTSFSLFADLHPIQAVINQPFSLVMFGLTVFVFAVATAEVVLPRDRWVRLGRVLYDWEPTLATAFLVFMGMGWVYKVVWMKLG